MTKETTTFGHEQEQSQFKVFEPVSLKPPICWHFKKLGSCKLGDACKFLHVQQDAIVVSQKKRKLSSEETQDEKDNHDNNGDENVTNNETTTKMTYMLHKTKETKSKCSVLRRTFEENGFELVLRPSAHLNVLWNNTFGTSTIGKIAPHTMINHFPNSHHLTNKSAMTVNLQEKCKFMPSSFVLPKQLTQFEEFNRNKAGGDESQVFWISKPLSSGEGKGIQVYGSYLDVIAEIRREHDSNKPKRRLSKFVVSEYIRNPLLINQKKMDLRVYVLLKGGKEIYLYRDGIVRFASEDYRDDAATLSNPFMHITNNTVNDKRNHLKHQTYQRSFGFYNNMNFKELESCFRELSLPYDLFWNRLKAMVLESVNLTIYNEQLQDEIYHRESRRCFELLGFDVLIDQDLNPHLLEVNGMPDLDAMSHSGHLVFEKDFEVKAKMLAECLNIVRVPLPPSAAQQTTSTNGLPNLENGFDPVHEISAIFSHEVSSQPEKGDKDNTE